MSNRATIIARSQGQNGAMSARTTASPAQRACALAHGALVLVVAVGLTPATRPADAAPRIAAPVRASGDTAAPATDATTPVGYVSLALDFIERYALRRTTVDFPAIRDRALARAAGVAAVADTHPIVAGVLRELGDRHATFTKPPEASNLLAGRYTGFGFTATFPGRIVVALAEGGPAAAAGLRLRDRIDRVNGAAPVGASGTLYVPRDRTGATVTRVTLKITRPGTRRPLSITIDQGQPTLVSAPRASAATALVPSRTISGRIGYLDLQGVVTDEAGQIAWAQSVHDAIRTIDAPARCGWVLDLRRNRGGYIYPMLAAVGPLVGDGLLGGKRDAEGRVEQWSYADGRLSVDGAIRSTVAQPYRVAAPDVAVAVLTSELTASAAEAVTIAFIGRPNTRSFGRPTLGLTTFTVMRAMPDQALLSVTNAVDVDRRGIAYDGAVAPDAVVDFDWATVGTPRDAALDAAVRWLGDEPACRS
jgi:C-terminal processing protease CtpA/Prc